MVCFPPRLKEVPRRAGSSGAPPPLLGRVAGNPMQYRTSSIFREQTRTRVFCFGGYRPCLSPGELLVVQTHALNPQSEKAKVTVDFSLKTIAPEQVVHEMGLLQFYDPFIYLPPKSRAKAGLRCLIPNDLTLLQANGHYHLRGTEFNAFIDPPEGPAATEPFLVSHDWQHPTKITDPIEISAGSHIRLRCDYDNPEERVFTQGQSKNDDEMCSFWGYAYPAPKDDFALLCAGEYADQVGVGQATCAETAECLGTCPASESPDLSVPGVFTVGPCFQKCMVDSCPNVSSLLDKQSACVARECSDECPGDGCAACTEEHCAAELSACREAACE